MADVFPTPDDKKELDLIIVPLAEVRMQIVEMMKNGIQEMPLGDFLLMIRAVIRKSASK